MTIEEIKQGMNDWSIGYNVGAKTEREITKQLRARIVDLEERLATCNAAIDELNAKNVEAESAAKLFTYQTNQMKAKP
jgi:uncharacterized coiled-coil protein SlyX